MYNFLGYSDLVKFENHCSEVVHKCISEFEWETTDVGLRIEKQFCRGLRPEPGEEEVS